MAAARLSDAVVVAEAEAEGAADELDPAAGDEPPPDASALEFFVPHTTD